MPEPLPPTLTEMRNSVLIRAGYNITDGSAGQYFPLVEEFLRRAQKELHLEAPWLRNWKREEIDTTPDESDYDCPDDAYLADLNRIAVKNTEDNEYDLSFGAGSVRNITKDSGQPVWFEIQDQVVRLHPAPTSEWPTLILEYYQKPSALVNDADRPTIDGEAMVQRATYYLKRHTGFGGAWEPEREEHIAYIMRLKQEQGEVRSLDMRAARRRPNTSWAGNGAVWTPTWNPWP